MLSNRRTSIKNSAFQPGRNTVRGLYSRLKWYLPALSATASSAFVVYLESNA